VEWLLCNAEACVVRFGRSGIWVLVDHLDQVEVQDQVELTGANGTSGSSGSAGSSAD
jgi:hypothetical protein